MGAEHDSQIMNYVVRMVTPMRREFGRNLNVQQFLHDFTYAKEVLDEAMKSQDPRLKEYADYIARRMQGPRVANAPVPPKAAATAPATPAAEPPVSGAPSADELRARVLKKYTGGLR